MAPASSAGIAADNDPGVLQQKRNKIIGSQAARWMWLLPNQVEIYKQEKDRKTYMLIARTRIEDKGVGAGQRRNVSDTRYYYNIFLNIELQIYWAKNFSYG